MSERKSAPQSPALVLASASPRRSQLLAEAGFHFTVEASDVDESNYPPTLAPAELPVFLAQRKAEAIAARRPDAVVLAADTIVVLAGKVIGKPRDESHARELLNALSGSTHEVISGVAIRKGQKEKTARVISQVAMRVITPAEIETYLAGGAWRGKAGAYGLQDDDPLVTHIGGCRTNIVGLPMTTTRRLLAEFGIEPAR